MRKKGGNEKLLFTIRQISHQTQKKQDTELARPYPVCGYSLCGKYYFGISGWSTHAFTAKSSATRLRVFSTSRKLS